MQYLATIGSIDGSIAYTDRPTVKVIIQKNDSILLLNNGLLPGGGINDNESDIDAISRELQEELGATVRDIHEVGYIIQYRSILGKKYIVRGYSATLRTIDGPTSPQDIGESQFTVTWLPLNKALQTVLTSIENTKSLPMNIDTNQGKLLNLMTTYELLKRLV